MSGQYDASLANNAAQNFAVLGNVVKVLSAPGGPVQIKLDGGEAYTLMEGQGIRRLGGRAFRDVAAKNVSGALQAISLFIGADELIDTRIAGIVAVSNKIGAGVQWIEGTASLALGFTAAQLIAPAANVRGILIRRAQAYVTSVAGGTGITRLRAALVAPTQEPVVNVADNSYSLAQAGVVGAGTLTDTRTDMNYQLPAGWGLWVTTSHSTNPPTSAGFSLAYEVS